MVLLLDNGKRRDPYYIIIRTALYSNYWGFGAVTTVTIMRTQAFAHCKFGLPRFAGMQNMRAVLFKNLTCYVNFSTVR